MCTTHVIGEKAQLYKLQAIKRFTFDFNTKELNERVRMNVRKRTIQRQFLETKSEKIQEILFEFCTPMRYIRNSNTV
jgi:hypothetical protein